MKNKMIVIWGILIILSMLLASCQTATPAPEKPAAGPKEIKVVNLINGVLGDKSFFDSANRGMEKVMADYPNVKVKTIEAGIDPAKWQASLEDAAANEEYDVLITGTFQMSEFLQIVAPK